MSAGKLDATGALSTRILEYNKCEYLPKLSRRHCLRAHRPGTHSVRQWLVVLGQRRHMHSLSARVQVSAHRC